MITINSQFNDKIKKSLFYRFTGYSLIALLLAMPFVDFLTILAREHGYSSLERISLAYRAISLVPLAILCSVGANTKSLILLLAFWFSFFALLVGHAFFGLGNTHEIAESLLLLLKFFLFFLFFQSFRSLYKLEPNRLKNFFLLADTLILIYVLSIILGSLFQIDYLRYYDNGRWGVKGIIISGNEASAFLLVSLAWFLIKEKSMTNKLGTLAVVFALVLSGTKASIVGMFILLFGSLWASGGIRFLYKALLLFILSVAISTLTYRINENIQIAVNNTLAYFEYQYYNHANMSIISLALSGRDIKLDRVYELIFNYAPWSLLIGGYPVAGYTVEMDIFDLIALMGFLGAAIYLYYWCLCWKNVCKQQDIYLKKFKFVFLFTFISLAFLGGHMFYSAVAAPLLALLAIKLAYYPHRRNVRTP